MDIPIISPSTNDYGSLQWDIVFCDVAETEYGMKVHLASPYEAKDEIKELDWDRTHRTWDEDADMWEIDLDSVGYVTLSLDGAGFSVAATEAVGQALDG